MLPTWIGIEERFPSPLLCYNERRKDRDRYKVLYFRLLPSWKTALIFWRLARASVKGDSCPSKRAPFELDYVRPELCFCSWAV